MDEGRRADNPIKQLHPVGTQSQGVLTGANISTWKEKIKGENKKKLRRKKSRLENGLPDSITLRNIKPYASMNCDKASGQVRV